MLQTTAYSNLISKAKSHRKEIQKFQSELVDQLDFKKYCSAMGIYGEKKENSYMLRIRIPAGVVTLNELQKLSDLADLYSEGVIHLTTRQDFQFHKLSLENTAVIAEELSKINLFSYGSGGNCVRNIACSPLSGVHNDEVFDVTDYALKTADFLLNQPASFSLPRKLKISFSNSPTDTAYAGISDLGFIAKIQDNIKGFEVYGAGGFGKNPSKSIKLEDFIPADEFLYHTAAVLNLFNQEGDRENRNKARLRYVLFKLGEQEFKNLYRKYLIEAREKYNFDGEISSPKQKKSELNSVYIHPENGNLKTKDLNKIIEFIKSLEYEPSIRLTETQGFFVRELRQEDKDKLSSIILGFTSPFEIDNSLSCVGASTCKIGLCKSSELLSEVIERFTNVSPEIKRELPKINISGCSNSCARHQGALIGFSGKIKKTENGLIESFSTFLGGKIAGENTVLGTEYGDISAKNIPDFLYELAFLKNQFGFKDFTQFLQAKKEDINKLIETCSKE